MDTSGSSSPEDEALRDLEDFLEELFGEVGIESVEDEDWVEVNNISTVYQTIDNWITRVKSHTEANKISIELLNRIGIKKMKLIDSDFVKYSADSNVISIYDYLEQSLIDINKNNFCIEYRKWYLTNSHYEENCWTLIASNIVNLNSVDIVTRKNWWPKYSQEDYVPSWTDKEWNIFPVNSEIYNYFYRYPWRKFADIYDHIVIHHSADPQYQTVQELEEKERKDRYYSMPYHFVIRGDGVIYEWRPLEFNGDHVGWKNTWKIGIVVMWDFEYRWQNIWSADIPTEEQLISVKTLTKSLTERFNIDPENIKWHNDLDPGNQCPWDNLEDKLEYLRQYSEWSIQSIGCNVNRLWYEFNQ